MSLRNLQTAPTFTLVLRLACELNEFGEINVTEKRRVGASKKCMKKHGEGSGVGLLIPALEPLEASRGGEACLRRSAPINSARRDLWTYGGLEGGSPSFTGA